MLLIAVVALWWTRWDLGTTHSYTVERLGPNVAAALMPTLWALEEEFYESDARHWAASDREMHGAAARSDFAAATLNCPRRRVAALAWCYSFDFK